MNNTYIIKNKSLKKLMKQLLTFEEKTTKFFNDKNFKVTQNIYQDNDMWILKMNINDGNGDEERIKEVTSAYGLL